MEFIVSIYATSRFFTKIYYRPQSILTEKEREIPLLR